MSIHTDRVLASLSYDSSAKTASLSSAVSALQNVRAAMRTAFGEVDALVLGDVALLPSPGGLAPKWEAVVLQGRGRVFNYSPRDVYVELGIHAGEVETLLVIVPLPPTGWKLATGFPALKSLATLGDLRLRNAFAVVSHGLGGVDGSRTVGTRSLSLRGYDLQDGLQLLSDGLVDATGALTQQLWTDLGVSRLPAELQPDVTTDPDRVEVRADVTAGWLQVEAWWDCDNPPEQLAKSHAHAAGLAIHYELGDAPQQHTRWLWEIGAPEAPVVLEAVTWPGVPVRYTARLGVPVPLGETTAALSALLGAGQRTVLPDPPPDLALVAMTYAPGQVFEMVTAAGESRPGDPHIVAAGPVELREVRYAVSGRLDRTSRTFQVGIEARATFFGTDFEVGYTPDEVIEGGLADPQGVPLGRFVEEALPVALPFGVDTLTLRSAWVRRTLGSTPATAVFVRLDGQLSLLPGGALTLEDLRFRAEHPDGGEATVSFGATFRLGPLVLRVDATHAPSGWTLEGVAHAPTGISLTDLLRHLAYAFGAAVPTGVPDVELETMRIRYEMASRELELQAIVDWTVDQQVPVVAGKHTAILTVNVASDLRRGGERTTLSLDWSLEKGSHTLQASAWLSGDAQTFSADLQAPGDPLLLTDLLGELDLDVTLPAAGALDEIFQVSTLSLTYARQDDELELAWARPVEGGTLLAELEHQGTEQRIKLSWIGVDEATIGLGKLLHHTGQGQALDVVSEAFGAVGLSGTVDDVVDLMTFRQLGFTWRHGAPSDELLFLARSDHEAVDRSFVLVRRGKQAGLVAGLTFRQGAGLSQLPFLPDAVSELVRGSESLLGFEPTHVLVSTIQHERFRPPGFAEAALVPSFAHTGGELRSTPFGNAAVPLGRGIALGGRLSIAGGADNILRKVVDAEHLDAQLTLSAGEVGIQAVLPGQLELDAGGGTSLTLADPMFRVEIDRSGPDIELGGTLDLMLFHKRVEASGWLTLSATKGLRANIALWGLELPPAPMLPGVHFVATEQKPLSLAVGLQFVPPGLVLGMKGDFYIQTVDRRYEGKVAFVLQIVSVFPQPLYVEFEIEALDIPAMLEAMTGVQWALQEAERLGRTSPQLLGGSDDAAADVEGGIQAVEGAISHLNAVLSRVSLEDVRIRWCESIVDLPDGTVALPGVGFRGSLSIFGWDAFAVLDFSSGGIPALTGHFEAEPIEIGRVVRIWGDGNGVRKPPATARDFNAAVDPKDAGEWFLEPGGPVLHVSTRTSPFLHADLHARLFGFLSADVHAEITDHGLSFDLALAAGPVHYDLSCHYWQEDGAFEASGSIGLHLHGDIGPILPGIDATKIHLDTDLEASIELRVDSRDFELRLDGQFNFQGTRLRVPELTLTVPFESPEDLAEAVWDHIVEQAEDIFEEVLVPIGQFVKDAAEEVAEVASQAAQAVEETATQAAGEVAQITESAVASVTQATGKVTQEAQKVTKAAADIAADAAYQAAVATKPLLEQAQKLSKQAQHELDTAASQVAAIALDAATYVEGADRVVAQLEDEARREVTVRLDEARRFSEERLADAARAAARFEAEAATVVASTEQTVEQLKKETESWVRKIDSFFKDDVEDFFEKDVGGALKSVFSGW